MPNYMVYKSYTENLEGLKVVFRKKREDSEPIPDVVEIPCAGYIPSIFGRIMTSLDPCYVAPTEGSLFFFHNHIFFHHLFLTFNNIVHVHIYFGNICLSLYCVLFCSLLMKK